MLLVRVPLLHLSVHVSLCVFCWQYLLNDFSKHNLILFDF